MKRKLYPHDIVTVLNKKGVGDLYAGKQGQVERIVKDNDPDGPVEVWFPDWYAHIGSDDFAVHLNDLRIKAEDPSKVKMLVRFRESDLSKDFFWREPFKTIQEKMRYMFGDMSSGLRALKHPFFPGESGCMHKGCEKKAIARIWICIHGTVYEYDACTECATKFNGICCDDGEFN